MAKRVILSSGREFKPLTLAKAHFSGVRERTPVNALVADPDRSDVIDIYRRYCLASGQVVQNAVDVTIVKDQKQNPGGNYAHTVKAFAVVLANGSLSVFNMEKALRAIAE